MIRFDILSIWPILGMMIVLVPLIYDHRKVQILNVFLGLLFSTSAYLVFCTNSCLWFAAYWLGFISLGSCFLAKFGVFDARFTTKKFVYYLSLALMLFYYLSVSPVGSIRALILIFISFGILLMTFPFHGWGEPFMMHAPSGLLTSYLSFVYPLGVFFMLKLFSATLWVNNYSIFSKTCLCLGTLGAIFVPILFFARTENRRFLAYLVSWNTGIMFLFLAHCSVQNYANLVYFAVVQGVVLGMLGQCFVYLRQKLQRDDLVNLSDIRARNRVCCLLLKFLLCASWGTPLILAEFFIKLPVMSWSILLISLGLYGFFLKNLLKNSPEKNYFSFG